MGAQDFSAWINSLLLNILGLGNSDSTGEYVAGQTWSEIARAELEQQTGAPVVFNNLPFSLNADTAVPYAEKKIAELQPDALVIPVGTFQFTAGFTWVRVRRLFGERAGRWYRELEERFEKKTRGKGKWRDKANCVARAAVRRVVGTEPLATREATVAQYRELFRAISRHEDMAVVLVTYPGRGAHARTKRGIRERKLFFPEVEAMAKAHHFGWVDSEQLFATMAPDEPVHTHDGLHFNEMGHQILGRAVVAALRGPHESKVDVA